MQEVSLTQILAAREARARRQKQLLEQYQKPLICFTMNIAGPVKTSQTIREGFLLGSSLLLARLAEVGVIPLHIWEHCPDTGCEGYYIADAPARVLKEITLSIEEEILLGRLFDMDVLAPDGQKIERSVPRRCLICDNPAAICGRSRAHSVAQLQEATASLLSGISRGELLGLLAQKALLLEVCCTPKPGLVDRNNSGSHRDMDIITFFKSITALGPYFRDCATAGAETAHLPAGEAFSKLRPLGIHAEAEMLRATGGINTHKGAIFTLGLLCAAAGSLSGEYYTPEGVCTQCAAMTAGLTGRDFAGVTEKNAATAGQRLYALYGIRGIRGEAEKGFPTVLRAGLPVLQAGDDWNDAGCAALLAILARAEDTNLIHRSDLNTLREVQARLDELLKDSPYPSQQVLETLDREFIEKNLSPGGSADLLSASWFLYFLQML